MIVIVVAIQAVLCTMLVWYYSSLSKRLQQEIKERKENDKNLGLSLALVATQDPIIMDTCRVVVGRMK